MTKRFRILTVDDDPVNTQFIESALKDDYDIFTASNGFDAVSQLAEYLPDLILLDVMMPDISGFDICNIIKADERFADIPIIFLTALDTQEDELRGLELGGIDYITKPFNFVLLKMRVRNQLALKKHIDLVCEQRNELARQKEELETALARVKQLEGIIPICSYCKKIRDENDGWQQLETYITRHSEAFFSHGVCPHCAEKQMQIVEIIKGEK